LANTEIGKLVLTATNTVSGVAYIIRLMTEQLAL
jgi:hypothetical protein